MNSKKSTETHLITKKPAWKPPGRAPWSTSSIYSQPSTQIHNIENKIPVCKFASKPSKHSLSPEQIKYRKLKKQLQAQRDIIKGLLPMVPELTTEMASLQRFIEMSEEANHDEVMDREDIIAAYEDSQEDFEQEHRRKVAALNAHYSHVKAKLSENISELRHVNSVLDSDISNTQNTIDSLTRYKDVGQYAVSRQFESIQEQMKASREAFSVATRSLTEEFEGIKEEINEKALTDLYKLLDEAVLDAAGPHFPELWFRCKAMNTQLKTNIIEMQSDVCNTEKEVEELRKVISALKKENSAHKVHLNRNLNKKIDFTKKCIPDDVILLDIKKITK